MRVRGTLLGSIAILCGAAVAQEAGNPEAAESLDNEGARLRFEVAPYLWAISMNGDAVIAGTAVEVDAPFTDTLSDSDSLIGLMAHLEMGRGKWSLFFDPAFSIVGFDDVATESGPGDLTIKTGWFEFGGGWRVLDVPVGETGDRRARVDAIAGARLTTLELDLDLNAGGGADGDQTWVEPFVGARGELDLNRRWVIRGRGDIGGFGAGSDFAWQAIGLVGWRFEMFGLDSTLFAGYRALGQDYDDGDFEWDVIAHGPALGLGIRF